MNSPIVYSATLKVSGCLGRRCSRRRDMGERLLKRVSIVGKDQSPLFSEVSRLSDLEIWTSRSKVINKHIQSIEGDLSFVAIVNPVYTPLWSIIDKPYTVYSSNEETVSSLQFILNHSDFEGVILKSALLTEISKEVFILFYFEKNDEQYIMKCILLNFSAIKFDEILNKEVTADKAQFIDEISKKDDLIDTLMRQPSFPSVNARKQAELAIKEQQMRRIELRQDFKKIISKEVRRVMSDKSKGSQSEVADICLRAMSFKFKSIKELDDITLVEVQTWLDVFMKVLGVVPSVPKNR